MSCILACIDLSETTHLVVKCATDLAAATGTEAVLLHVADPDPDFLGFDPGPQSVRDAVAERLRHAHRQVQRLAGRAPASARVQPLTIQGPTVDKILDQASRLDAAFIVIGSHGHGALYDLVVGSVANALLKRSSVPLVVVPSQQRDKNQLPAQKPS